jgi:hypothetical protein
VSQQDETPSRVFQNQGFSVIRHRSFGIKYASAVPTFDLTRILTGTAA